MALGPACTSGSVESIDFCKESLPSGLEEKALDGGNGHAMPRPKSRAQNSAKERLGYMDSLPCASRSQRSRILMNSISGTSSDSLHFDGRGPELPLSVASRRTRTAWLRPAPRPVLD